MYLDAKETLVSRCKIAVRQLYRDDTNNQNGNSSLSFGSGNGNPYFEESMLDISDMRHERYNFLFLFFIVLVLFYNRLE